MTGLSIHCFAYLCWAAALLLPSSSSPSSASRPSPPPPGFSASVTVQLPPRGTGTPANPNLLGSNLEWVHNGDGILLPNTLNFNPSMLQLAQKLGPTILRFPGGAFADLYHWRDGMGPLSMRGSEAPAWHPNSKQTVTMGTAEFLTLCQAIGATPMITVNVATGSAEEAAAWVKQTNITGIYSSTGQRLPSVPLWEIGNEPYLDNGKYVPGDVTIKPVDFAARFNEFVTAMKAVDPSIRVLLPLRSDAMGGHPSTPFPGFIQTVLKGLTVTVDYVAVHDSYFPHIFEHESPHSDLDMYQAAMAGTNSASADLASIQLAIGANPHTANAGIMITEYNAIFTQPAKNVTHPSDAYIDTIAGALYVADALRLFATTPNLSGATYWSLLTNWKFGVIDPADPNGNPRPAYWALSAYKQLLQGTMAPVSVQSPTFSNPAMGYVPAYSATPTIAAVATLQGSTMRVMIINKDPEKSTNVSLNLAQAGPQPAGTMNYLGLVGPDKFSFANALSVIKGTTAAKSFPIQYQLPAHSYVLLTVPLR